MRCVELLQAQEGRVQHRSGSLECEIASIEIDSRQCRPGSLFVALRGASSDGHRFLDSAIEKGAVACLVCSDAVVERDDVILLEAPDTRAVVGELGATFYGHPMASLTVVGVTGTNGKTTCTHILEHILAEAGFRVGAIGTTGYRWPGTHLESVNTTPGSLEQQKLARRMVDADVTHLVMEVSSHALATHRMNSTPVDVAAFTNLSQDHLDFHPTMAAYRDAKRRLFDDILVRSKASGRMGCAVVNADDPEGALLAGRVEKAGLDVRRVQKLGGSLGVESVSCGLGSIEIQGQVGGETYTLSTQLMGEFNAENVLLSLQVSLVLGVELDAALKALETVGGPPGRLEQVGDGPWVFVDYAHTPDALEKALKSLQPFVKSTLWVVFGCGGDRDRPKRPIMARVAELNAEGVIVTSDNPRSEDPASIVDDILGGFESLTRSDAPGAGHVHVELDRARAIEKAILGASSEDVILIAGKGHEAYQEIEGVRHAFDDVAFAKRVLSGGA